MTIYSEDSERNITIAFDSRWRYPETLGYKPTDQGYRELQKLWEEATGETIPDRAAADVATEVLQPAD